jgi:vitamin B12 transporter
MLTFQRRGLRLSLLALAVASASPAFSQSLLDPVVVTASRSPQRLSQAVAEVRVIDREAIERLGSGSLADLLQREAGLEISRNGGPASTTSLFLRGADSRHTVVLLDGVRVDSQATGGASWQGLPLASIERIEVLSGPASALYGSDAIGGVVQLFTRKAQAGLSAEGRVAAGNLGQRLAEASVRGGTEALRYSASLNTERADGFNASTPAAGPFTYDPDRDGWQRHSAHLRGSWQVNAAHAADATWSQSRVKEQFDAGLGSDARDTQRTQAAGLTWRATWAPTLRTEAQLGQSEDRYEIPLFGYSTTTRLNQASLLGFWQPAAGQQLQALAERRTDRLRNNDVAAGSEERHQDSLGLGWTDTSASRTLQLQARHDRDSVYGGVSTGLVGGSLALTPSWRLAGSVGTGFRVPTVYQLASPYGVRGLRPERSTNAELALRWQGASSRASATVYRNAVKDLINFGAAGPCASPFGCYANVSRALLQGLSLRADGDIDANWRWRARADFGQAKNRDTGLRLARRAAAHGSLGLQYGGAGPLELGANVVFSRSRYDNAANTRRLGGYGQLDLDASYTLAPGWRLQAQLTNAGDKDYATAGGYNVMPRSWLLGLRVSL